MNEINNKLDDLKDTISDISDYLDSEYKGRIAHIISKMKEISNLLIGQHDFRGFCSSNTATQDFVRTIFDIKIYKKDNYVFIEVCGSGFLYNMVRIIVGTLVDYSLDKINKENVLLALNNGNRNFSGRTMPAEGLYLKETFY